MKSRCRTLSFHGRTRPGWRSADRSADGRVLRRECRAQRQGRDAHHSSIEVVTDAAQRADSAPRRRPECHSRPRRVRAPRAKVASMTVAATKPPLRCSMISYRLPLVFHGAFTNLRGRTSEIRELRELSSSTVASRSPARSAARASSCGTWRSCDATRVDHAHSLVSHIGHSARSRRPLDCGRRNQPTWRCRIGDRLAPTTRRA